MGLRKTIKYWINKQQYIKELIKDQRFITEIPSKPFCKEIVFPIYDKPIVSIIIPYYNQQKYTWECLKSILENLPDVSFEIILVNDNSSEIFDFSFIQNIKIINNVENIGFLKSVNNAINVANGEYIYLLNNDTVVSKGFLDELYYVFKTYDNVGAVGSKLLNADGSLQEAGCVFTKDCTISQIVKKEHYYPEVNYIYQVDYCSGCSILFKKHKDNNELNTFDTQFAPAYFEETDLCFDLKYRQDKDIYYTPFSQIVHFNGVSYNAKKEETLTKKQELFEKNLKLFKQKWEVEINKIQAETTDQRLIEICENKSIIFFYNKLPAYDNNSGELRLTEIIKAYKNLNYHVTLISPKNRITNSYLEYFQKLGVCTFYEYLPNRDLIKFLRKFSENTEICWFYTADVFKKYYKQISSILKPKILIYDMVDISHLRFQRALQNNEKNTSLKKAYKNALKNETIASRTADIVIPISKEEGKYMEKFCSNEKMVIISNIHYPKVNIENIPIFEDRSGLLFIGSHHHPNIDSVQFMVDEIMPVVWQTHPEIVLNILGDVNLKITRSHPKVIFHGYVPDVTSQFLNNRIMIAPLRYGAGVKGKIGQAFEYYLPVVTSKIGAEGMELIDNKNVLLAEDAKEFAEKIIQLYTNKNLWKKLQDNSEDSLKPFSKDELFNRIKEIEGKF